MKLLLIHKNNCLVHEDDSDEECTDLDLDEEEGDDVEDEEIEANNRFVDYDSEENEVPIIYTKEIVEIEIKN